MANNVSVTVQSNLPQVKMNYEAQIEKALNMWGILAQGYATMDCPVDTGNLKGSIDYSTHDNQMDVGTNVEYAPYVEYGTGIFASEGNGRQSPWSYQDSKGNWHRTNGMKPQPFLGPSIQNHVDEYEEILKECLEE